MAKESAFKTRVIHILRDRFPGCVILKNDELYIQGFPDMTILYKDRWAALEFKKSSHEKHQPNQDYYVKKLDKMSYAAFIYPENMAVILDELQQALEP